MITRLLLAVLAVLAVGTPAAAQDPPELEAWRWNAGPLPPHSFGIGGASAAPVDGTYAYATNPAALTLIRSRQLAGSTAAGSAAITFWPGKQERAFTLGAYLTLPLQREIFLDGAQVRGGLLEFGQIEMHVAELGVAGAVRFGRLRVGLGGGVRYLSGDGSYTRQAAGTDDVTRTGVHAHHVAFQGVAGVMLDVIGQPYSFPLVRVGAVVRPRQPWRVSRADLALPPPDATDTAARDVRLRESSTAAFGVNAQLPRAWILTAEGELSTPSARAPVGPTLQGRPNEVAWRAGVEKGGLLFRLRARAGVYWGRPRYLLDTGEDYEVGIVAGAERELLFSAGGSWAAEVLKTKTLAVDVDISQVPAGAFRIVAGATLDF